jgi:hypothetical protein
MKKALFFSIIAPLTLCSCGNTNTQTVSNAFSDIYHTKYHTKIPLGAIPKGIFSYFVQLTHHTVI